MSRLCFRTLFVLWVSIVLSFNAFGMSMDDFIAQRCKQDCVQGDELLTIVSRESGNYNLHPIWTLAIINIESGFRIHADSNNPRNLKRVKSTRVRGSKGLMQVLQSVHQKKIRGDIFDVNENVRVGTMILGQCTRGVKGVENMLSRIAKCYNGGPQQDLYRAKLKKSYYAVRAVMKLIDFNPVEQSALFNEVRKTNGKPT